MAAKNIIKTYGLEKRICDLEQGGFSHVEIANELNSKDLAGKETISQPTISRWLKKKKKEDGQVLSNIRREYREKEFAKDMEIINERIQFNYMICNDVVVLKDNKGKVTLKSEVPTKDRREAEREMREWLKLKAHYCGLDAETGGMDAGSPVNLDDYRMDKEETACNG